MEEVGMKTLHCYRDEARWGLMLHMAAQRRGIKSELFRSENLPENGTVFYKMNHHPSNRGRDKANMQALSESGVHTIPQSRAASLYDDKIKQGRIWNPESILGIKV